MEEQKSSFYGLIGFILVAAVASLYFVLLQIWHPDAVFSLAPFFVIILIAGIISAIISVVKKEILSSRILGIIVLVVIGGLIAATLVMYLYTLVRYLILK